jgi:ATP-dependent phosphoenolpyruvate carboxykinase
VLRVLTVLLLDVFLQVPTSCPGVPAVLLQPALQWADKAEFNETLSQLAALFVKNFKVNRALPPTTPAVRAVRQCLLGCCRQSGAQI